MFARAGNRIVIETVGDDVENLSGRGVGANVQKVFRCVNDRMRELEQNWLVDDYDVMCECRDLSCTTVIRMSPEEYEAVLAEPGKFGVVAGHEQPQVEHVVARRDRYAVVAENLRVSPWKAQPDTRRRACVPAGRAV
jgi:hypothetical protein